MALPDRFPSCPHHPVCAGCTLRSLSCAEALAAKEGTVAEAFARFPSLARIPAEPCRPGPTVSGYRTRVKLAVAAGEAGRPAAIGLFAPGTHEVLDLPDCEVIEPALRPLLASLRRLLSGLQCPVRHLDLRWSRHESRAHLTLVVAAGSDTGDLDRLASELMERHPELAGIARRTATGPVAGPLYGPTEPLVGRQQLEERLAGNRFMLSPGTFFQADPAAAELLHAEVRTWLLPGGEERGSGGKPGPLAVDLYAGVAPFALTLAAAGAEVVAVEVVDSMADDARRSAELSGLRLRVERLAAEQFAYGMAALKPQLAVVDPPRRGLAAAVLTALGNAAPARFAYVSCDPETAARDTFLLAPYDLVPSAIVPFDLFAATARVELVVRLAHRPGNFRPVILAGGPDWLVASKPPLVPTHPAPGGGVNMRDLVRRAAGAGDLQPVHRLDAGTTGPLLLARGAALSALGRRFEEREVGKEYLALVKGVPRRKGRIAPRQGHGQGEESRYRLEDVVGGYGLVRVMPLTGGHHQVRRHLAAIGHPILGDDRYGDRGANRFMAEVATLVRPFLHLERLSFEPPGQAPVVVEEPLSPDLELVLKRLAEHRHRSPSGRA